MSENLNVKPQPQNLGTIFGRASTSYPQCSTKVPLPFWPGTVKFAATGPRTMCEELQTLKRKAVHVIRTTRKIRRSRDLTFYEDAELAHKKHSSLNAILKHLLAGHEGKPCPSGDRPIVRSAKRNWPYR
jgi:hypothetical protein